MPFFNLKLPLLLIHKKYTVCNRRNTISNNKQHGKKDHLSHRKIKPIYCKWAHDTPETVKWKNMRLALTSSTGDRDVSIQTTVQRSLWWSLDPNSCLPIWVTGKKISFLLSRHNKGSNLPVVCFERFCLSQPWLVEWECEFMLLLVSKLLSRSDAVAKINVSESCLNLGSLVT